MKQFTFLLSISTLCMSCCRQPAPASVQEPRSVPTFFVSGVYAAFDKSAYCRTWDTVTISRNRGQFNVFRIKRHTRFQRNREDDFYAPEHDWAAWTATYDPQRLIMLGPDDHPDLTFRPEDDLLVLGDHHFSKIE